MDFQYDKFANTVLSLVDNGRSVNKTGLLKLLFLADFKHYALHGCSITGSKYVRLPRGPVPDNYEPHLDQMTYRHLMRPERSVSPSGHYETRFVAQGHADEGSLSDDELDTIESVSRRWYGATATRLVNHLHRRLRWLDFEKKPFGEEIPYSVAFALFPTPPSDSDYTWAASRLSSPEIAGALKSFRTADA